ncbi:hypothetical protein PDIG_28910 [Penicillium digitatum PHI26]|uniref:Uncharacterized protein n=2 Tax=Penicillium digitatum TaxID=36651 RepID=K9FZ76_PEND2|nr:hypothetical protein PDIP_63330 [Penicillium digitatum Pd1]EKV09730.1 hypothetical protein PDIP_63330 [Penicillium digitatum Pd1]EKV15015.1 hypothetical protein PDIG_28910 [Penicillium digitatum PHI26]
MAGYACIYWVDHLQASSHNMTSGLSKDDGSRIDVFLERKYLHWLEFLSILGRVSHGIQSMQKLENLIQKESELNGLLGQAQDAYKFIQYHRTGIESSPVQVYYSSLLFSPSNSLTRGGFQEEKAVWVLNHPVVMESWSPCLQTLEGHTGFVSGVA